MNRFKRIASRGWLNKALSILTFGYFPASGDSVLPVDWCVSDTVLHTWTAITERLHYWLSTDERLHAWAVSSASPHDWTTSDTALHTWTMTDETAECD